ncbi:DNA topoisomerase I [candidate division TM6 bacterium RIFCSPHIGHO2_12_FULL_36_22]|nr:MAG: DNA topoisomerase I [candidate division TM6 bacterium RIFCSPHIGHO2_12_FULL_36_22]
MKKLLIVESPAKIKTISKFLGSDFRIMSTVGHIKDLPSKSIGVTMGTPIKLEYVTLENKEKVIADICKQASTSDEIYLAPDPDREGEIIAWHIEEEIKKVAPKKAKIYRITFNEITKPAIIESLQHLSDVDMQKVAAQQARRVLDRWVGYEVSPILWQKLMKGLSAGRVQSVALKLICDREEVIRDFKPEEYWSIQGEFQQGKAKISADLAQINKKAFKITNKQDADKIINEIKKDDFIVESIQDKKRLKNPLPPFMTSTLQQAAYNRLGFSVKKTMTVAQKLYEGIPLQDKSTPVALITYMRTDSLRISDTALKQARGFIKKIYGDEYLPKTENSYEKKKGSKVQDAHEAIRPIDTNLTPEQVSQYLPPDAAKLYKLIWQRFVACQMTPAEYAQRQVTITSVKYLFRVTGSTLVFDGFLKVYNIEEDEDENKIVIPKELEAKKPIDNKKTEGKQHFTQPPPRFSEASLVKELEKEGIGRPSTYSAILSTIQARNYTALDSKKRFIPTELGMQVTKLLVENLPHIINEKFTARMEEELDKVESGDLERDKLLNTFYKSFSEDLVAFKGTSKGKKPLEPTNIKCPKCKKEKLVIRFGKAGEFLGCPAYPECDFTSNFERTEDGTIKLVEMEKPKLLDMKCPECGKPLRSMVGRFGPFISCSGYPECKYIHQEVAKFPCPDCGGKIGKRSWKGKTFWGCKNYPKCKFVIFSDIEETECPKCKSPYLLKRVDKEGNVILSCPVCDKEATAPVKRTAVKKTTSRKTTTVKKAATSKTATKKVASSRKTTKK